MYDIEYKDSFFKSLKLLGRKIDDHLLRSKIEQLRFRPHGIGKRLVGVPYWSLRVGKRIRLIYRVEGNVVTIVDLLERKHDYREL